MNHYDELVNIRDRIESGTTGKQDIDTINAMLEVMDEQPPVFFLDANECKALWDYLLNRAGVISYEFDGPVHKIYDRLMAWLTLNKQIG